MAFTTEQLLLAAGILLIVYTLIGGGGLTIAGAKLPPLAALTKIGLCFFGVILMFLGISSQIFHAETTFESPTLNEHRLDICMYSGGYGCGYEAATTWCRTKGYKLASIWSVDSDVGNTIISGNRLICQGVECSAFRTVTCMR
jgi:hypothetical protein